VTKKSKDLRTHKILLNITAENWRRHSYPWRSKLSQSPTREWILEEDRGVSLGTTISGVSSMLESIRTTTVARPLEDEGDDKRCLQSKRSNPSEILSKNGFLSKVGRSQKCKGLLRVAFLLFFSQLISI
jgi:hypothetical protein